MPVPTLVRPFSRRGLSFILMLLVVQLSLSLAACGTQPEKGQGSSSEPPASASVAPNGDADALMAQAKSLAKKTSDLAMQLYEGHLMMAMTAENADAAEAELAKAKATVDEMRANETSIVTLLDAVMRLDESEKLTTYAGQQKEIAEIQLRGTASAQDLLGKIGALWKKGKPGEADLEQLFMAMAPSGLDDPLAHLEEKGQASREFFRQSGLPDRYYMNNGLGEAYDTPDWQTEEQAGGVTLAYGFTVEEGPAAGDGQAPGRLQASFEMSLAEAMQAQRAALEDEGWSVGVTSSGETSGVLTARNPYWKASFTFKKAGEDPGTVVVRMKEL